jgi:hypothetical protein
VKTRTDWPKASRMPGADAPMAKRETSSTKILLQRVQQVVLADQAGDEPAWRMELELLESGRTPVANDGAVPD